MYKTFLEKMDHSELQMKIEFGEIMSKQDNWEVYSYDKPIAIQKKYWRTYECAVAYAKRLNSMFVNDEFRVRWCKPKEIKPIKRLTLES